jgi:hypothetical protein
MELIAPLPHKSSWHSAFLVKNMDKFIPKDGALCPCLSYIFLGSHVCKAILSGAGITTLLSVHQVVNGEGDFRHGW